MNILFFGSSHHSLLVLNALSNNPLCKIVGIVSQPARPVGRKKTLSPTPVSEFAKKHSIPLFTPETLYNKSIFNFSLLTFNLIIVADYGLKLPKELIELPKYGALNLHPSLLPAYRGSSPAQWAILRGEKETGITILTISEEFDQGKIIAQKKILILPTDTQETLYKRCFKTGAEVLLYVLSLWFQYILKRKHELITCLPSGRAFSLLPPENNRLKSVTPESVTPESITPGVKVFLPPKLQPAHSPTPYARKLTKDDGQINWSKPDAEIERMIRAFDPWPGTYTTLASLASKFSIFNFQFSNKKGSRRVKILKARLNQNGKLQIDKLQIEGKKPITWEEFSRGYLS